MIVRHYCVAVKRMSEIEVISRMANPSVLAAEIEMFLRGNDENVLAEICDWQSANAEFGSQIAKICIRANIVNDGIVDSAVRLSTTTFGLEATRAY